MAESSLIPVDDNKKLAAYLMNAEDVENFLEVDLRKYEDVLTSTQARELVRELAYWLMYISGDEKGRPHTHPSAYKLISNEYRWLLDIAGLRYTSAATTRSHAENIAKRKWEEHFEGRTKYAAIRFRDRMLQVDRLIPVVENAVLGGDLTAVDKFVALARLDMDAAGYKAPTKYEFSADVGGELTEADKQQASEAIDDARKFEDEMLGNVVDGSFENVDEEE